MNTTLVNLLNNIPLGYALLLLVTLVSFIVWVAKVISNAMDKHRETILQENEDQETKESMLESIKSLKETVMTLKTDMDAFHSETRIINEKTEQRLSGIEEKIDDNNQKSIKRNQALADKLGGVERSVETISNQVHLLIGSDKESVKIFITNEYHKWMQRNEIDIYALESVEERLAKYRNAYSEDDENYKLLEVFVKELRGLPVVNTEESQTSD